MEKKSGMKLSFLINGILIQSFLQIILISLTHTGLFGDYFSIHGNGLIGLAMFVNMLVFILVLINVQKLQKASEQELIIEKQQQNIDNLGKLVETIQQQKHDFVNHIQVIKGFSDLGNYRELKLYIDEITNQVKPELQFMSLSRMEIKSLLLVKAGIAKEQKINFDIAVTHDLDRFPLCKINAVNLFGNMIDNAFRASIKAKKPYVKIYIGLENDYNVIKFYNNGSYIPKEIGDEIFYKGYTTKEKSGGLGLYIVKNLVSQYQGTMVYTSNPETGTEFVIRIPTVVSDDSVCHDEH